MGRGWASSPLGGLTQLSLIEGYIAGGHSKGRYILGSYNLEDYSLGTGHDTLGATTTTWGPGELHPGALGS